jgi:hypothetical protein
MACVADAVWAMSTAWTVAGVIVALIVLVGIIGKIQVDRERKGEAASGGAVARFPLADASGHLICKYCGKVFAGDTTTIQRARDFYAKASRKEIFVVPCHSCGKPNLFLDSELRGWRAGG